MIDESAPAFLDRALVDLLHERGLLEHGGADGVRDSHGIDSAIGRARMVYSFQPDCDVFDIAATYAHGLAEAQGYVDGNKRVGVSACLVFLESNSVHTDRISDEELYAAMIDVANKTKTRDDVAKLLRTRLQLR